MNQSQLNRLYRLQELRTQLFAVGVLLDAAIDRSDAAIGKQDRPLQGHRDRVPAALFRAAEGLVRSNFEARDRLGDLVALVDEQIELIATQVELELQQAQQHRRGKGKDKHKTTHIRIDGASRIAINGSSINP